MNELKDLAYALKLNGNLIIVMKLNQNITKSVFQLKI